MVWDIATVALRILLPVYAIVIVYQCYAGMRRHKRPEKPLIMLYNKTTDKKIPVLFWENSIGRSKGSDICIADDPTVSRDHCVLLRRNEGWFISDVGSKSGTFVNGKEAHGRKPVYVDDEITVGTTVLTLKRGSEYNETIRPSWFFSKSSDKGSLQSYKLMILITFFHLFMTVEAMFASGYNDVYKPFIIFAVFEAVAWAFFFVSTVVLRRVNFELEALAIFMSGIGAVLLARQVFRSAIVQTVAMAIGMVLFCVIVKFIENPDRIIKWRLVLEIATLGLFAINIIFGDEKHGAANWVSIGPISFQPSELAKVLYIFVGASVLDNLQTKRNLIEFIGFSALCVLALAWMSDLGTALIFFATFLVISFMRSGDFKTLVLALAGAVFGGAIIIRFKPYIGERFKTWGHALEHAQEGGYQQARVLTYIASGGLFGVGIGNGLLKHYFASESDLVFGIICEEMGVIMGITLVMAIVMLVFYARAIATRSRSTFYSISACCAAALLVVQLALNVFGATDILPLTGVTFPFISAGGSSVMSCWGLFAFIKAADERTYAAKRGA